MIVVHASDLHFGPHLLPDAVGALERMVERISPDLLVLSGDFTHRANRRQFDQAKQFIGRMGGLRVIVTPGNHDVPLYSFWRRIFSPYKEFRQALGSNGDFALHYDQFSAAILDTTSPYLRITEGRLSRKQVEFLRSAFLNSTAPLRMVVMHHPVAKPEDWRYGRSVDPNRDALTAMVDEGVELVLGGHLHRSFSLEAAPGLWVVHSGTTTSSRGRSEERGMQTFNLIRVRQEAFDVEVFSFNSRKREFESLRRTELPRQRPSPPVDANMEMEEEMGKAASGI
jgi:3',5'-cyclic AMP phosphodiesterase CpdA